MTMMLSEPAPTKEEVYLTYGAAKKLFAYRGKEVVLSGPAGTGKSRACLEKLHTAADKYAGMRALIVRKTRESITQTTQVTYERKVLPAGWLGNLIRFRTTEQEYRYPNGSIIALGGLDKVTKIMSSEYDMIYVQEAIEVSEDDWESLTTRLRNGVMPYQQLLADTNPNAPTHWLKRRADRGAVLMLESRHEDNPMLYDHARDDWTPEGKSYIATLDDLSGVRRLRLRYGTWAAAEGLVYEDYDAAIHLKDRFEIPRSWRRYWAVDFGYRHPFVWQAWAEDPDGRLYLYREIYMTHRLVSDHAAKIQAVTEGEPLPDAIVCDHDAEGRATLEDALGMATIPAYKAVSEGIQAVQARLRKDRTGKPALYILRDSLVERDARLEEKKLPTSTTEELEGYIWNTASGRGKGEEPVKENDHGVDALRYITAYKDLDNAGDVEAVDDDIAESLYNFRGV